MPLDDINIFGEKNINLEARDEQIERLRQIVKSSSVPILEKITGLNLPEGLLEDDFKDIVLNEILKNANIPVTMQKGQVTYGKPMDNSFLNFSINPKNKSAYIGFTKRFSDGGIADVPPDMLRVDGTKKNAHGFLGPIQNNATGRIHTELSTNFDDVLDGRLIPFLVPTLTKEEIDWFRNNNAEGNPKIVPESIKQKAIIHAIERDKQGLSPFYQDGETMTQDINIFGDN